METQRVERQSGRVILLEGNSPIEAGASGMVQGSAFTKETLRWVKSACLLNDCLVDLLQRYRLGINEVSLFLKYGDRGAGGSAWCIYAGREPRFRVFINGSWGYQATHVEIDSSLAPVDTAEGGSEGLQAGGSGWANRQKCGGEVIA